MATGPRRIREEKRRKRIEVSAMKPMNGAIKLWISLIWSLDHPVLLLGAIVRDSLMILPLSRERREPIAVRVSRHRRSSVCSALLGGGRSEHAMWAFFKTLKNKMFEASAHCQPSTSFQKTRTGVEDDSRDKRGYR